MDSSGASVGCVKNVPFEGNMAFQAAVDRSVPSPKVLLYSKVFVVTPTVKYLLSNLFVGRR